MNKVVIFCLLFISISVFGQNHDPPYDSVFWAKKLAAIESETDDDNYLILLDSLCQSFKENVGGLFGFYGTLCHKLGSMYCWMGDYEKGIPFIQEAVHINKNSPDGDESFLVNSYYNLGFYYRILGSSQLSLSYLDSCIKQAERYPIKNHIGVNAYEQIAAHFFDQGEYYKGRDSAKEGILFAKDTSEYLGLVFLQQTQAYLGLDPDKISAEELNQARYSLEFATKILQDFPEHHSLLHGITALFLERTGQEERAVHHFQKAIQLCFENDDFNGAVSNLSNLGNLYDEKLRNPDMAVKSYQMGFGYLEDAKNKVPYATLFNNIGSVYWNQKSYDSALYYYQKGFHSLPIAFYDHQWQSNPSRNQLKKSDSHVLLLSLLSNKGQTLLDLHKATGNDEYLHLALSTLKSADFVVNQMRWSHSHEQSKLFWREKTNDLYENAIEVCFLLQRIDDAFYFFEKSRAVLLNEKLSELGAQQILNTSDQAKEHELKVNLIMLNQKLSAHDESDAIYRSLLKEKFKVQDTYDRFIKKLETAYPSYYQYKYDTSILTLQDLRELVLDEGQTYISYFNGKKGKKKSGDPSYIYTIGVDKSTAFLTRVAMDNYQANMEEMLALVSDKEMLNQNYNRYVTLSHAFYKQLFQDLPIQTNRIIVSPDNHFLPFELLLTDPEKTDSYLVKKHAFSYTYSAEYLLKSSPTQKRLMTGLLGLAPVNYQPHLHLTSIMGADVSLNGIKKYFSNCTLFTNEKATKGAFLKHLKDHSIVHLYSHAESDYDGKEPVIYFQDSVVHVTDLQMLGKLATELIVLSACNTGIGKSIAGEGIFSLARGFASAGIPSSINTLWEIENQSTYRLSELFYQKISEGEHLDIALQQAKLNYLASSEPLLTLPYAWAGNILIGKTAGFEVAKPFYREFWFQLFGIAFLVLFLAIGKRRLLFFEKRVGI